MRGSGDFATHARRQLASLFVNRVLVAVRAELLSLEAIGVVAAVLLGDVVAMLAVLARHGDLGTDVCCLGHGVLGS